MRLALVLSLAALPFATTAQAGGISAYTFPHLTWPSEPTQPDVPTRQCPSGTILSETSEETACETDE